VSKAVTLRYENNIAIVQLLANTFTKQFCIDIESVFTEIREQVGVKVVLVHGHDTYFSCGGSKEELEELINNVGKASFDDLKFYRFLLDCELPTISAMQGHALGGGLAFGCYGDILLMSEKSMYGTNFMKYGFTPGMGGSHVYCSS
jgi:polyketide biosynthesis enoyl-CoA hydratase PksI